MPKWLFVSVVFLLILGAGNLFAHEPGSAKYVVEAYRLEPGVPAPKIDGKLDDPAWQKAKPVSGFIQLVPDRAKPATDDTAFYIAYDPHHLYVAFRCYDEAPDKVVNRIVRRGGNIYDSDVISFFMDPHHDHRTGYKFATTPGGVQSDAYRFDDIRSDSSWRGIWWLETGVDEQGWVAEFKIPFANFRFPDKSEQVWGFDVERVHRRKDEVTVWKQMTQAGATTRMSDLGLMVGLKDIGGAKPFEISPYLLGGVSDKESLDGQLGTGLDVQYNLTSTLKTNVTVNPDFAQVEADQLEINLTRFPTRFPERRPFFVEGNSFFETPLELFYSRRIGREGDILWGGKMTGKVGSYSLGILGSQTGSFGALEIGQESESKEEALYSTVRLKKDILDRSSVGLIFANKEHLEEEDGYGRVGGFDTDLFFLKTYRLSGQYALSFNPSEDSENENPRNKAYLVELAQSNYLWNARVRLERIDPLFNVEKTGFLEKEEYRGGQQMNFMGTYIPRFGAHRAAFGVRGRVSQDLFTDTYFDEWEQKNSDLTLSPEFEEDLIGWNFNTWADWRPTESFWEGIGVSYGRRRQIELTKVFTADGYEVSLLTNTAKPVSVGLDGRIGDYFNFKRQAIRQQRQLSLSTTIRPQSNFTIDLESSYALSLTQSDVIDERHFTSSLRVTYLFTRDLFLRVFTQARRKRIAFDQIEIEENYLVSTLVGWEYSPKSHIFLAYNEDWQTDEGELQLGDRVVVFKVSYLWNL